MGCPGGKINMAAASVKRSTGLMWRKQGRRSSSGKRSCRFIVLSLKPFVSHAPTIKYCLSASVYRTQHKA